MSQSRVKAGHAYILIEALDKTQAVFTSVGKKLNHLSFQFAAAGVRAGLMFTALSVPMASVVNAAREFSDEILFLQTKLKASDAEMVPLIAHIKEMTKSTTFLATDIAKAATALAQGGFSRSQIVDSLQAVLDMARGARMELGTTAGIIVDTLTLFSMKASQAEEVADAFFVAAKNGTIEVADLAQSFSYTAQSASAMGLSLQETLSALSVMSLHMLKSTKAGTSFNQLLEAMSVNADKLQAIGVNPFTAEGGRKPILSVLTELALATSKMSLQQRRATLVDIFNVRGVRSATALADQFGKSINMMAASMEEMKTSAGISRKSAEIMDKEIGGSIRRITATINMLKIEIGLSLSGAFKSFSENVAPLIQGLAIFIRNNKQLVVDIAKTIAIIGVYSATMLTLAASFKILAIIVSTTALALAIIFSPIRLAIALIGMLVSGVMLLSGALTSAAIFFAPFAILAAKVALVTAAVYYLARGFGYLIDKLAPAKDSAHQFVASVREDFTDAGRIITSMWSSAETVFKRAASNVASYLKQIYEGIVGYFMDVFSNQSGIAKVVWNRLVDAIKAGDMETAVKMVTIGVKASWEVMLLDMQIGWLKLSYAMEEMILRTTAFFKRSWFEALQEVYKTLSEPLPVPKAAVKPDENVAISRRSQSLLERTQSGFNIFNPLNWFIKAGRAASNTASKVGPAVFPMDPQRSIAKINDELAASLQKNTGNLTIEVEDILKRQRYELEKLQMEIGKLRIIQPDMGSEIKDEAKTLKDVFKDLASSAGVAAKELMTIAPAPETVIRGTPESFEAMYRNNQIALLTEQRDLLKEAVQELINIGNPKTKRQFGVNPNTLKTELQIISVGN